MVGAVYRLRNYSVSVYGAICADENAKVNFPDHAGESEKEVIVCCGLSC